MNLEGEKIKPTFSGHDSFPCRNFWLKKGFDFVLSGKSFSDDDAVVQLGVGKNMVGAIRYWMKAFGIIDEDQRITNLGYFIFSNTDGVDPYLEDDATLWLLHYHLVKTGHASTYSLIFNYLRKERIEFTKQNFIQFIQREIGGQNENTLNSDFNVFSRMYVRNTARSKDREDNLSELLNELNLVDSYRSEKLEYYIIENQERGEIPDELILYAILDKGGFDMSVNFKSIESDFNSVGNIFAISRHGLFMKIQNLVEKNDYLVFNDQAGIKELQFKWKPNNPFEVLKNYYGNE
ncbi:DUF4007 family protein [Algoriphagus kandeliae]|uniref:DUF4007 family protein n=1 Tax=Algoriphagus kandeliae TaxID=2562278 RepID=A0A4Y9QQL0_9BACT|nr:DUF4007 family protein [Algoriphagus kandeliae]TFV94500.1 DUF4007 family protein [Algoriphagus kandeliae]